MKNALTIFRRDFSAYFTSPIGYIFMIVFLLIGVGLYITSFFTFPVADMRPFFSNLPILLCVFIPAVTMRIWAEERKENTWEMLLTFPMSAWELVLGKFLAVLAFYAITLAATCTVPIMLAALGDPDSGGILGGYLGTFLLGAFFLSIGIFISGLCKDQIVAFVVTLLVCFAIFLVGLNFIAAYVDGVVPGLGSRLAQFLGMYSHFDAFVRGVVEMGDVLYFLVWTGIFLFLNMLFIEGRHRPRAKVAFAGTVTLCFAIGFLFNWLISGHSLGRFDLTEDKIYTVSAASKSILKELKQPVQVNLYITPRSDMPVDLKSLEDDIEAKLDELQVSSGGKLKYKAVHLQAANVIASQEDLMAPKDDEKKPKDKKEAIEERMLDKGVKPFPWRVLQQDQTTSKLIYSSLGIAYGSQPEEILTPVMPQTLPELEYRLVSTIYKLSREKKPVIALVAPEDALNISPEMRQIYMQMGQPIPQSDDPFDRLMQWLQVEKYDVRRVQLTQASPLPEEYDALVVINPRGMNERQRWEIARALHGGKPVVMAVQNYEWDYQQTRRGMTLNRREENPQVNELLEQFGLSVDPDILMDENSFPLNVASGGDGLAQLLGLGQPIEVPIHIMLKGASMNKDVAITSRLEEVLYLWGSAVTVNDGKLKELGLAPTILMETSDKAWTVPADQKVSGDYFAPPQTGLKRYPVMVMVEGQFPDVFKDKPRPAWAQEPPMPGQPPRPPMPEDGEVKPVTPAPGKLIVLGGAEMFRKNFLEVGNNIDLALNSVDAVSLDERLVEVRGMKPTNRVISKPSEGVKTFWKFVNYALGSIVIAAVGITVMAVRRNRRNAYTAAYAADRA